MRRAVLIAGVSGRALAASARRAGYLPLVADAFGDLDTLALSCAHVRLRLEGGRGIAPNEVMAALEHLAEKAPSKPIGIVCGSGFEDRPLLLATLAQRFRLLGNPAETVDRAKDPVYLASLCRSCGIAHPLTSAERPAHLAGWLLKRRGGAGGSHIRPADANPEPDQGTYYQRRVNGTPVSALLLANGRTAMILGFSAQWWSPTPRQPFRYGGAVHPAPLRPGTTAALAGAIMPLAAALKLVGLNSIDFLVDDHGFWLLEVNPRPGATLDIFAPPTGSLFGLHVSACDGELPTQRNGLPPAMAQAIVYADQTIASLPAVDWPDWTADRQASGSSIKVGDPVCSVLASATTSLAAKILTTRRIDTIRQLLAARSACPCRL